MKCSTGIEGFALGGRTQFIPEKPGGGFVFEGYNCPNATAVGHAKVCDGADFTKFVDKIFAATIPQAVNLYFLPDFHADFLMYY